MISTVYFWHEQSDLKIQTPKNLIMKEVLFIAAQNEEKTTKCRNGVLTQSGESILPLNQSGMNNFALGERKNKKKFPLFRPFRIQ